MRCWWLLLLQASLTEAATIQSLNGVRSNALQFRLSLSQIVTGFTADDVHVVTGEVTRRSSSSQPVQTTVKDFVTSNSNCCTTATWKVEVSSSPMDFEVPITVQIEPASFNTQNGTGPNARLSTQVVFDVIPINPVLTSLVGSYSNLTVFNVAVDFGKAVANFSEANIELNVNGGTLKYASPGVNPINKTAGQYELAVPQLSGEGNLTVTILAGAVKDLAGNANSAASVSIVRDITPVSITLSSEEGLVVDADSFRVIINASEPIRDFDHSDLLLVISHGRGAAGRSDLTATSPNNVSWEFTVNSISAAPDNNGAVDPVITVSVEVISGALVDRAGNFGPLPGDSGRTIAVIANLTGINGSVLTPWKTLPPTIRVYQEPMVGDITVTNLIIIVCVLGGVLLIVVILVILKKRKEAREAPDAFKAYGRKVFEEYGIPPSAAGITLDQIVQFCMDLGYNEKRSRLHATRLMKDADTNQDGLLSEDEFVAWCSRQIRGERKRKNPRTKYSEKITHADVVALKKDFPLMYSGKNAKAKPQRPRSDLPNDKSSRTSNEQEMEPMINNTADKPEPHSNP